jgi:HEAT repeat protein
MPVNTDALIGYLELMRGNDPEHAFFGLLHLGSEAVPLLIAEAARPENESIRPQLVEVIWQYRDPRAIEFLGQALSDPEPEVWKEALDGLVAIGGQESAAWLKQTQDRLARGEVDNGLTADWISEALEQIETWAIGSQ